LAEHTSAAPRFTTPEAYTPKHLAERILLSRTALEGERKQVTVLFADLKGSMELLADRDPEEAQKILDAVLERMMEAVHRYEGTVNQVMGDGIMALFGAPVAHEDHAARACYAALRMQDSVKRYAEEARHAHGVNVRIRVGLNSGDVVVRAIGSDLRMDYTAVGQTTHLAARMEQLALPGTIVMTPATLDLVEGLVAVSSLGPMPVKGLPEPLEVFEVTGVGVARTRLHAAARRGLTRFVGRDGELEQLWRAQELAAKGRGQVTAVVGEAGVGKSRLLYEFTHSHRLEGWLILEAASVPYGKATSYLPVIDLLKSYFKIQDRDELHEIREKVTGKVLTLDRTLQQASSPLLSLLDVPVDDPAWQTMVPQQKRRQTLDGVKRLLLREAREQPLLLIFEDLHWIDGETQALLDGLVDSLGSARLLLLVNYRPEYQHGWAGKTYYSQLRLDALPPASAADLLDALLGDDPGHTPLKQLLIKRGNPFFVEETIRTLVETKALVGQRGAYRLTQPIGAIQIPSTVQAMLAARIDRLPQDEKRLLQVASVVGKDVPLGLLQSVADVPSEALRRCLDHLQAAEFVYELGFSPDPEYSFKHALTHEVTYSSLLQDRRREIHARVVGAIETLHATRLTEHVERLAHHAHRGALGEKAVHYLRQAGLKATDRSALEDAWAWLEQALDVLDGLPESHTMFEQGCDIRLNLWPVAAQLGVGAPLMRRLREAMTLAEKLGDERRQGQVGVFMTNILAREGRLDQSLTTGARTLEIADRLGDLKVRIATTSFLVYAHHYRGDHDAAVDLALQNIATLPAEWLTETLGRSAPISVFDRWLLVRSLADLGRFSEAGPYQAEAIRIAEELRHPYSVGMAYFAAGTLHLRKGEWSTARSLIEHGIDVSLAAGAILLLPPNMADCAWILAQLGESKGARVRLQEAEGRIERHAERAIVVQRAWVYHALGRACVLLDEVHQATQFAKRAIECARGGFHGHMAYTQHLLGDIAAHPARFNPEEGEDCYRQALRIATDRRMRPLVAHCHLGLGRLYLRTGKREEAGQHLTEAMTLYREMDMTFWLEQAGVEFKEPA
jgi:class 3 adenylate cyclase/tetratricopeptide (TPR) repeat protein